MKISRKSFVFRAITKVSACLLLSKSSGEEDARSKKPMAITAEVKDANEKLFLIKITVQNLGDSTLLVNDPNSEVTRGAWSVFLHDPSGARMEIRRLPNDTTVFKIKKVKIEPSIKFGFSIDLLDGTWLWPKEIGSGGANQISIHLNVPNSRMFVRSGIWMGHEESKVVNMPFSIKKLFPDLVAIYE